MCQRLEAIDAIRDAANDLSVACERLCPDAVGVALKSAYDETLKEVVPQQLAELMTRLK